MGFLGMFGIKKGPSPKQIRDMLPSLHSFVDVQVRNGPKGSVCFENSGISTFVTSVLPGMSPGQVVNFFYSTSSGKFRFSTSVKAVDAKQATFEIPDKIETLQKFGGAKKRTNVRIDTTITSQWRYSSTGKIESEWQKGVLSDISRTGSSLATDKVIKSGTVLELKIPLKADGSTISLRAEAKRVDKIENTQKHNVGLAFHPLSADADRAIIEFINRRQVDLRNRGLG
ncbi:MAG TPA: PilZ domain-containing protein [Candidatus Lustribacter sp.]|nr:PilZ domain-containing protein [Candidatus Lustribacter sp.]